MLTTNTNTNNLSPIKSTNDSKDLVVVDGGSGADVMPVPSQVENYKAMERNFGQKASTPQRHSESDSSSDQTSTTTYGFHTRPASGIPYHHHQRNRFNSINESNPAEFMSAMSTSPSLKFQIGTSPSSGAGSGSNLSNRFFIHTGGAGYGDQVIMDDLEEETILDTTHNENVEKLNCILVLCNYLIELAKSRFNPFLPNNLNKTLGGASASSAQGVGTPTGPGGSVASGGSSGNVTGGSGGPTGPTSNMPDQFTVADVSYKKAEQLVIYLKCLQLLKPVLCYAKDELEAQHLKSTIKVRKIMRQLNNMYKFCLYQCKQLYITEFNRNKWNSEKINLSADKLLYLHAIELCREAAMEEFFGKPQKV